MEIKVIGDKYYPGLSNPKKVGEWINYNNENNNMSKYRESVQVFIKELEGIFFRKDVKFEFTELSYLESVNKKVTYDLTLYIKSKGETVGVIRRINIGDEETAYKEFYGVLIRYCILIEDSEEEFRGRKVLNKSLKSLYNE